MIIKRHKEVYCDICGKDIGRNYKEPFGMRSVVRVKEYLVNTRGELGFIKKVDLCRSCYNELVSEINARRKVQSEENNDG